MSEPQQVVPTPGFVKFQTLKTRMCSAKKINCNTSGWRTQIFEGGTIANFFFAKIEHERRSKKNPAYLFPSGSCRTRRVRHDPFENRYAGIFCSCVRALVKFSRIPIFERIMPYSQNSPAYLFPSGSCRTRKILPHTYFRADHAVLAKFSRIPISERIVPYP